MVVKVLWGKDYATADIEVYLDEVESEVSVEGRDPSASFLIFDVSVSEVSSVIADNSYNSIVHGAASITADSCKKGIVS